MEWMNRLESHVAKDEKGCWLWLGSLSHGNPVLHLSNPRRIGSARRWAYEQHNGVVVPQTHVVVALCRADLCVNPSHGSAKLRGTQAHGKFGTWDPKATHCQRGHEWTEWNSMPQWNGGKMCRACHYARTKAAHQNRRPQLCAAVKRHTQKKLDAVAALKTGCVRCPETHPACLDFHHRDGEQKTLSIAAAVRKWPLERVLIEVGKCDVLCSNCHRKLHWAERRVRKPDGLGPLCLDWGARTSRRVELAIA
jgi:hypothetical protein